jgi:hypothetical protein
MYNIKKYTEALPDGNSFEAGFKGQNTFPYKLSELKQLYPEYQLITLTPYGNTLTKDFALSALVYERLGKDSYTDVLIINFASTGKIADLFGLRSVELEDAYIRLDNDIAHLLTNLEQNIGTGNFMIVLTSDKGICDYPVWLKETGFEVNYFNPKRTLVVLNSYLRAIYGMKTWVNHISGGQIYLNRTMIDKDKIPYENIETRVAEFLSQLSAIYMAIPAVSLFKSDFSDGIMIKAKNTYNPRRSGDVLYILRPYYFLKDENTIPLADCPSAGFENSHVPLIFYGWKIKPGKIYKRVSMNVLATTLSYLNNIETPQYNGEILESLIEKL